VLLLGGGAAAVAMAHASTPQAPSAAAAVASRSSNDVLRLAVSPSAFGSNRFLLTIPAARGAAATGAHVTLSLLMTDMVMGGSTIVQASAVGAGRYQVVTPLNMPGHWRIIANVTGKGLPASGLHATFRITAATQATAPVPRALPLVRGGAVGASVAAPSYVSPSAVRWPTALPYKAIVTFLDNGLVYLPGRGALVKAGALNHSVARAPDGSIWATDYNDYRVTVIDPHSGRVLAKIPTGIAPVHMAFTRDGLHAYVSDYLSSDLTLIDVQGRRKIAAISLGDDCVEPHGLQLSPNGRTLWVPCSLTGIVQVLDTTTGKPDLSVGSQGKVFVGGVPHAVAFSPDGKTAYLTDAGQQSLWAIDETTGKVKGHVAIGTGSAMLLVGRDGRRVYVSGQAGHTINVVDARTLRLIARIPVGAAPHGLAFTPDSALLYVAANNGHEISVIDVASDKVVANVPVPGKADELTLTR